LFCPPVNGDDVWSCRPWDKSHSYRLWYSQRGCAHQVRSLAICDAASSSTALYTGN
jgi:hypothetical protein